MDTGSSNSSRANSESGPRHALARIFWTILFAGCAAAAHAADDSEANLQLTIRQGDTLIGISQQYLANPAQWRRLQQANRIANPRRLNPGSILRIPLAMLREEGERAEVISVSGSSTAADGTPLAVGNRLATGAAVRTGADGFLTLRMPDGSLVAVQPGSEARIAGLIRYVKTDIFGTFVRMVRGRIEAVVNKLSGASRFEVQSDVAVAAVRGTRFRVGADTDGGGRARAQTEVIEGGVDFAATSSNARVSVAAGYGSVTDEAGRPRPPALLLPAPQIAPTEALQERLVTRIRFPAVTGASKFRAQVASDNLFRQGIAEGEFPTPEIKFADLADGAYFLRVRQVDALGLEGHETVFAFRLKARPEPPLLTEPAPNGRMRATTARFAWASNPQATTYRLQVAEDEAFARVVQDAVVADAEFTSGVLPFGDYYWRVRSIRGSQVEADPGPWGDMRKFTLRPPPLNPEPPEEAGGGLAFAWGGEPGQKFLFQVARDPLFTQLVEVRELTEPRTTMARPPQGTYYLRIRATDADGFVGPFTAPQRFMVINRVIDSSGANLSTSDGSPVRLQ